MAQKSIENEALPSRKSDKSKVFVPAMQPNSVTSQLQSKGDSKLFSKSSRNPCASPWCQPVETESSENGIKPEPVTALAPQSLPSHESDASGGEFLETMRKLAVAAMLPRSELSPFDGNPLNYLFLCERLRIMLKRIQKTIPEDCNFSFSFARAKPEGDRELYSARTRRRILDSKENACRKVW